MQNKTNTLYRASRFLKHGIVFMLYIMLTGCTGTKFLKEGETFYTGAKLNIKPQGKISGLSALEPELEEYITPQPNNTLLGMRPGVWFYYVAGTPKKKKGIRNFIKTKLGKEPVLLKDATPQQTAQALEGQLHNDGYFKSKVSAEVNTKGKKSRVVYHITLERPYRIGQINYLLPDAAYAQLIEIIKQNSLIKENQKYSLALLSAEQQRIEDVAQNAGFYYFDDRHLLFKADSTVGNKMIDLDLTVEPGMPERARRTYTLRNITLYPNYTVTNDSLASTSDTLTVDHFTYIDNQHNFKPRVLTNVINLKPDSMYRRIDHEYTLSHLMGLNTFKYVNIKYRPVRGDSAGLSASIFLTPHLKKSLRMQLQGVSKSNNFVGPGLEFVFTNRNLLKGAELFQFKMNGSYEMQIRSKQTNPLNAIEFGAEASLSVPRFITPIRIRYHSAKYLPQTQFKAGFTLQQRLQYFRLMSFNINTGYTWRETTLKTHELFPVDITFVRTDNTSQEFEDRLAENAILRNSFQNQFILGLRYAYTINTQLRDDIESKYNLKSTKRHHFYLNASIELSGNIPYAIQSAARNNEDEPFTIFNTPYSQFVRPVLDFRHYWQLTKKSKIASRLSTGLGYAFGNSQYMPYIKQFSMGGSNSLRAFPARSVGPGTFNYLDNNTALFIDQRGDIKVEANVEYRFDIISALKGGLFVDAGNIWLMKNDAARPGGQFDKQKFLKEIAVGTGAGLRLDFSFFVLRVDVAFPIRKTYTTQSGTNEFQWAFRDIDFGSQTWRHNNLVYNIAIGYPF